MWAGSGGRDRAILNRAADRFTQGCALAWRPFRTHAEPPLDTPRHVTVIGAGIVGICCAIELRRRGLQVTVVDRLEPGQGCSFGNAGILAAQAVVPIGLPGLARQLPRMLFDGSNPLTLRRGSLPRSLPWLWRLQQASRIERVQRIADAMKALYGSTLQRHQALAAEAGATELVRATPGLYVHRRAAGIDLQHGLAWRLRHERGARWNCWKARHCARPSPRCRPSMCAACAWARWAAA